MGVGEEKSRKQLVDAELYCKTMFVSQTKLPMCASSLIPLRLIDIVLMLKDKHVVLR